MENTVELFLKLWRLKLMTKRMMNTVKGVAGGVAAGMLAGYLGKNLTADKKQIKKD